MSTAGGREGLQDGGAAGSEKTSEAELMVTAAAKSPSAGAREGGGPPGCDPVHARGWSARGAWSIGGLTGCSTWSQTVTKQSSHPEGSFLSYLATKNRTNNYNPFSHQANTMPTEWERQARVTSWHRPEKAISQS